MSEPLRERKAIVSAQVEEYVIPPIKDLLILGRQAPIGCIAMRRALDLLVKTPFEHIEVDDDVIGDILVRQPLLRRLPAERLERYVLTQVRPLMGPDEILHVDLEIRVLLDGGEL
jgi:hypothetical protein